MMRVGLVSRTLNLLIIILKILCRNVSRAGRKMNVIGLDVVAMTAMIAVSVRSTIAPRPTRLTVAKCCTMTAAAHTHIATAEKAVTTEPRIAG
jgi:hypothetical protein